VPITLAQAVATNTSGGTTQLTVTPGVGVTNGNGLIVAVGWSTSAPTSVTDNNGVALAAAQAQNFFGSYGCSLWWLSAASGSPTSVKVNFSGSNACQATVYEVVGAITPNAGNGNNANVVNPSAGAFTTTNPNTVAVACVKAGSAITAQPAGYSLDLNAANFGAGYQVYTATQTGINPTWTTNTSSGAPVCIEAFTSSVVGAPPPVFPTPVRRALFLAGPWPFGLPYVVVTQSAPPVPPPTAPVPPVMPMVAQLSLALRVGLFHRVPVPPVPFPPPVPPVPPPPPPGPGRADRSTQLRRQSYVADDRRDRRASDQLADIVNSLTGKGHLIQTGPADWVIVGAARTQGRDPLPTDDVTQGFEPGMLWLNTATRGKFMCVDNTAGAAVWDPL
jgi:hypothetical protein